MKPIYLDLHIHTSEYPDNLNQNYNVDLLLDKIKEINGNSEFLISLTDHNTINKNAYMKLLGKTNNVILGVELHIKNAETKPPYHCHIYFNLDEITEEKINDINVILDELYPEKVIKPERMENGKTITATKVENIETIIRKFDKYDFLLLPHGAQSHSTFDESVDGHFNTRLEKSLYYNQFDGFTGRNKDGLDRTIKFFKRLGISDFINLITSTDNYNPTQYPNPKSCHASSFLPTWMLAEPTFEGLRLSLSESSRLIYGDTKPKLWAEYLESVKLENDDIKINATLTSGLNVVIGDSSSGKTLFVDTIMCKTQNDFSLSRYKELGVEAVEIDNPTGCVPHYINQNYIIEVIGNNKNEIEKLPLLQKIFPDETDVAEKIKKAKAKLKQDIDALITYVEHIESAEKDFKTIPFLDSLILNTAARNNPIKLLLPSDELIKQIEYPLHVFETHVENLDSIKEFMKQNKFIKFNNDEIEILMNKLEKAYTIASFEEKIRNEIDLTKNQINALFLDIDKETETKNENFNRLLLTIKKYTDNLNKFKNKLIEIQNYAISLQSKTIESMGHKLFIEYTFTLNKQKFLDIINSLLKPGYKIDNIDQLKPSDLYLHKYKDKPKIDSYGDFKREAYITFEKLDQRKYRIETRHGRDFEKLSAGWKTSVLLDLILGYEGDTAPLIIDQPEDNLANNYINKELIDAIKKVKEHKQVIIVSHNATIPMLGDAQNIILCKNDEKIIITSNPLEGKIDGKNVVDHIATITDGGKTSIRKRVKKYNMKKFEEIV